MKLGSRTRWAAQLVHEFHGTLPSWLAAVCAAGYFHDNIVTHLVAGLGAGFFAVCVGSPVDVVKSRVMGE